MKEEPIKQETTEPQKLLCPKAGFCMANMYPINRPEFMLSNAAGYFDEAGKLKDEYTRQRLRALLDALVLWTLRLKGGETVT